MDYNKLFEFLSNLTLKDVGVLTLVILLALLGLAGYVGFLYAKKFIDKMPLDNVHNTKLSSLKTHLFFTNMLAVIKIKLPSMDLGDVGRTRIFQDMLRIKFNEFYIRLLDVLDEKKLTNENFLEVNERLFNEAVEEYERKWKERGVPDIVSKKFHEWHLPRCTYTFNNIREIATSQILSTITEKMHAVLSLYNAILEMTIIDGENALVSLNGELAGLNYSGFVIGALNNKYRDRHIELNEVLGVDDVSYNVAWLENFKTGNYQKYSQNNMGFMEFSEKLVKLLNDSFVTEIIVKEVSSKYGVREFKVK